MEIRQTSYSNLPLSELVYDLSEMAPVPRVPIDDATFRNGWEYDPETNYLSESYLDSFSRYGRRPTKIDSIRGPALSLFVWMWLDISDRNIYTSDTILIMLTVFGQPRLAPIHL